MSFILDALKKAEQNRHQDNVPDLRTVHSPLADQPRKRPVWVYLLIAVLLVNSGIMAWFLVQRNPEAPRSGSDLPRKIEAEKPTPANPVNQFSNLSPPAHAKKTLSPVQDPSLEQGSPPAASGEREAAPANPGAKVNDDIKAPGERTPGNGNRKVSGAGAHESPGAESSSPPRGSLPPPSDLPTSSAKRVYALDELPPAVRQTVPAMNLSLHFYTREPASRMVRINGRNLREGDAVSGSLRIDEITSDGVILRSQGYRFQVPDLVVGHLK